MTLKTRLSKINATVKSIHHETYRRNASHRAYTMYSPTSSKPYQVITDWSVSKDGVTTIMCGLYDYSLIGNFTHPANQSKYICSQFLASVKWAAQQAGKIFSMCKNFADAKRLLRFGGQLVRVKNHRGSVVWATIR